MIGEILYIYDWNNHVYRDGARKREPWIALKVIGETRTSWVLEREVRVAKDTMEIRGSLAAGWKSRAYTEDAKADAEWRDQHEREILRMVERADTATLRKVAAVVGYSSS